MRRFGILSLLGLLACTLLVGCPRAKLEVEPTTIVTFAGATETFTVTNGGATSTTLNYEITVPEGLTIPTDQLTGALAGEASAVVEVTVDADVAAEFSADVIVKAGRLQRKKVTVSTCPVQYFTMSFDNNADLVDEVGNKTLTFTPDGDSYTGAQCIAELVDTTDAEAATLGEAVVLPAPVDIYGVPYDQITILEDGAVELSNASKTGLEDHFANAGVSGLRTDLDAAAAGASVTLLEAEDGVVVTYTDIPETGETDDTNTFQIVLYNDGSIALSYEDVSAESAVIGLSPGGDVPSCFAESDFSNYEETTPATKAAL